MPTYQYACTNPETKHEFEVVQSFTDPAVDTCPECGAPVRKVYGSVGVVFKGSGFYRTDSRAGGAGGKKDAAGSASTPSPTSSKSEAKTSPAPSGS